MRSSGRRSVHACLQCVRLWQTGGTLRTFETRETTTTTATTTATTVAITNATASSAPPCAVFYFFIFFILLIGMVRGSNNTIKKTVPKILWGPCHVLLVLVHPCEVYVHTRTHGVPFRTATSVRAAVCWLMFIRNIFSSVGGGADAKRHSKHIG